MNNNKNSGNSKNRVTVRITASLLASVETRAVTIISNRIITGNNGILIISHVFCPNKQRRREHSARRQSHSHMLYIAYANRHNSM